MANQKMNISKPNRLVFLKGNAPAPSGSIETSETPEAPKYVPFTGNPEKDINALAEATQIDAEKINDALFDNLKEPADATRTELWNYLVKVPCKAEAIVDKMLQFYSQDPDTNEYKPIKIGQYLKSIDDVTAAADADVSNHTERLATYSETKGKLTDLLAELKQGNPAFFEKLGNKDA